MIIIPVIHHISEDLTRRELTMISRYTDHAVIISMDGKDDDAFQVALRMKQEFRMMYIGFNALSKTAQESMINNMQHTIDFTWSDEVVVSSEGVTREALDIAHRLQDHQRVDKRRLPHRFFTSCAFKYQAHEPNPGQAAIRAAELGFIPTTSGDGTGIAVSLEKLSNIRAALNTINSGSPLAVASGVTPQNFMVQAPYLTHVLINTGISRSGYLQEDLLRTIVEMDSGIQ